MKTFCIFLFVFPLLCAAQNVNDNQISVLSKDTGIYQKVLDVLVEKGLMISDRQQNKYIQTYMSPTLLYGVTYEWTLNVRFHKTDSGVLVTVSGYFKHTNNTDIDRLRYQNSPTAGYGKDLFQRLKEMISVFGTPRFSKSEY